MLQKSAVKKTTLELLNNLMQEPLLSSTRLVGGTSLALQIGHRKSTDLDLFTTELPDIEETVKMLQEKYGYNPQVITDRTTIGLIENVKIDVIHHPYKWIDEPNRKNNFRLASIQEIAAMKLHAIANSGQRPKDFVDIAFLSDFFSYNEMKEKALEKYPMYDPIMFDRAIIYFDDINTEAIERIKMIDYKFDWKRIKQRIIKMTDQPDHIFKNPPLTKMLGQQVKI